MGIARMFSASYLADYAIFNSPNELKNKMKHRLFGIPRLLSAFAIAASLQANTASFAQTTEPPDTEQTVTDTTRITEPSEALKAKVLEDVLMQYYYENPRIVVSHHYALQGEERAKQELARLEAMVDDPEKFVSAIITPDITNLEIMVKEERAKGINAVLDRQTITQKKARGFALKTAKEMGGCLLGNKMPEHVRDVYDATRAIQDITELPENVDDFIKTKSFQEIAEGYTNLGLDDQQLEQFLTRGFKNSDNVIQAILIESIGPNVKNALQGLNRLAETIDSDWSSYSARQYLSQGVNILSLIDEGKARELFQAGTACIETYEIAQKMIQNNVFDPTGFAQITNVVNLVAGKMGNTPSNDEIMIDMLKQILANQQKMINILGVTNEKIDRLQRTMDDLVDIININHERYLDQFNDIKVELEKIEQVAKDITSTIITLDKDKLTRDLTTKKSGILGLISDAGHDLSLQKKFYKALQNPDNGIDKELNKRFFDPLTKLLNEMGGIATESLQDLDNNTAFMNKEDFRNVSVSDLQEHDYNDVGMLGTISEWLYKQTAKGFQSKITFEDKKDSSTYNGLGVYIDQTVKNKSVTIPNPNVFSQILDEYMELIFYRPSTYDSNPETNAAYIPDFCEDLNNIEKTIDQMRKHLPLVVAVFDSHLNILRVRHSSFIKNALEEKRITFDESRLDFRCIKNNLGAPDVPRPHPKVKDYPEPKWQPKPFDYSSPDNKIVIYGYDSLSIPMNMRHGVFYENLEQEAMERNLSQLTDEELIQLGEWCGVFKRSTRNKFLPRGEKSHEGPHKVTRRPKVHYRYHQFFFNEISLSNIPNKDLRSYADKRLYKLIDVIYEGNKMNGKAWKEPFSTLRRRYNDIYGRDNSLLRVDYERALAKEIHERQNEIKEQWKNMLASSLKDKVLNLHRARFIYKMFLEMAYGENYNDYPQIKVFAEILTEMNKTTEYIENHWVKGDKIFDVNPEELKFSKEIVKWEALHDGISKLEATGINIPNIPKHKIPYLMKAYQAMKAAQPYETIRPPKSCAPSFD